ncbi:CpsD/CapB family tyrosine-protein kinase [Tabrizicola sp.]|uniref:CpsD/CapB family tyrosine-protein kinase n=1 Tax=Tabrizicola sp. TaxID=2005166 RepID=UPI001A37AED5|nr:CpsD/CapB family tyrosine-protein kinase [Tabrizicola sp.]MBL9075320.1 CpsD/CapB family tyrosine-protein kinase [Tabrizicola sp.]
MERIQSALAKARSARDRKLQTGTPAADSGPWQELAEIRPDQMLLARNRIVTRNPGKNAASFDVMRTNLLRALRANSWTRVAVTSPTPGSGKSTVALNLAFSLARLTDKRVLLVELDLRRPSLSGILGLSDVPQFATRLREGQLDMTQVRRVGSNLALALSGTGVTSPAELLSAPRTADLIDALEARLRPDVILFDMSPMLVSDDALAFLDQVDCALMVAAAEETTVAEIEKCGKDLAMRTQVLGVVLNKCRYMEDEESRAYSD